MTRKLRTTSPPRTPDQLTLPDHGLAAVSSVETESRQERWKSIIPRETYYLLPHQVTCYKKTEEGGIEVLDEGECSGKKPELEEPCSNENSCEAADWIVSGACLGQRWIFLNLPSTDSFMSPDKSSCEGVCGLTHSSMHAICADGTGQQVGRVKKRHRQMDLQQAFRWPRRRRTGAIRRRTRSRPPKR